MMTRLSLPILSILLCCCGVLHIHAERAFDEVTALPGWKGSLPSRQFSGYLNITSSKHVHYLLVESENAPASDPTVIWLNGGPGCSSLDGYIYEHGPLRIDPTDYSKLEPFEYAWSKQANMLYLEAPVGVGFSYSDDSSEYTVDDDSTAADNLLAVEAFFEGWPEWRDHALFITGESYAGVYVPTLAEAIMKADEAGTYTGAPLHGIAVGNGCTGSEVGVCGGERDKYGAEYVLGTALINNTLKGQIRAKCGNFSRISAACRSALTVMGDTIGHVNIYDVYGDCVSGAVTDTKAPLGYAHELWGGAALHSDAAIKVRGPDDCIDSRAASSFFNDPRTIAALHVVPQPFRWSVCGNQIHYTSTRRNLPRDTYPALIAYTRVVIYNGDWDLCVPYTDNEAWTEGMGLEVDEGWHAWAFNSPLGGAGQVGGQLNLCFFFGWDVENQNVLLVSRAKINEQLWYSSSLPEPHWLLTVGFIERLTCVFPDTGYATRYKTPSLATGRRGVRGGFEFITIKASELRLVTPVNCSK